MDIFGAISGIVSPLIQSIQSNAVVIGFNLCIFLSIGCALALMTKLYHEKLEYEEIFNINQNKNRNKAMGNEQGILKKGFLGTLYTNLRNFMIIKDREKSTDMMFYIILGVSLFLGIAMFSTGQKLMGVLLPFGICYLVSYVLSIIKVNRIDKIREQIPATIDNITRVMTKYSALKTILYEASASAQEPMRSILKQLSLRMSSESGIDVLNDFMEEYNDIWIYSFSFTLVSYLEDSEKADVIANLKELRDIINKEIEQKKAEALEKKMTVAINYVLVVLGVGAEFANIMFNPGGSAFFFKSVGGFAAFLVGNGLLITCVISNIMLTRK